MRHPDCISPIVSIRVNRSPFHFSAALAVLPGTCDSWVDEGGANCMPCAGLCQLHLLTDPSSAHFEKPRSLFHTPLSVVVMLVPLRPPSLRSSSGSGRVAHYTYRGNLASLITLIDVCVVSASCAVRRRSVKRAQKRPASNVADSNRTGTDRPPTAHLVVVDGRQAAATVRFYRYDDDQ